VEFESESRTAPDPRLVARVVEILRHGTPIARLSSFRCWRLSKRSYGTTASVEGALRSMLEEDRSRRTSAKCWKPLRLRHLMHEPGLDKRLDGLDSPCPHAAPAYTDFAGTFYERPKARLR